VTLVSKLPPGNELAELCEAQEQAFLPPISSGKALTVETEETRSIEWKTDRNQQKFETKSGGQWKVVQVMKVLKQVVSVN
jgi:hypothetical protein